MRYLNEPDVHLTGDICPGCEQEVVLLAAELGAGLVECDCGRIGILSAA